MSARQLMRPTGYKVIRVNENLADWPDLSYDERFSKPENVLGFVVEGRQPSPVTVKGVIDDESFYVLIDPDGTMHYEGQVVNDLDGVECAILDFKIGEYREHLRVDEGTEREAETERILDDLLEAREALE